MCHAETTEGFIKMESMLVIPLFLPHAGCPFDCCYCNQKTISGRTAVPTAEEIQKILRFYQPVSQRYSKTQVAFYGGSFTCLPEEEQQRYLNAVQPYLKSTGAGTFHYVDSLRLSTRPDAIDGAALTRLWDHGVASIELGAQSMDDEVLCQTGRGHCAADTVRASRMIQDAHFQLGLQTMTGLPGATPDSDRRTAERIAALRPDFVRIYPTLVFRDTTLEKWYREGRYRPCSLEETIVLCAGLLERYRQEDIRVIRLGLQSAAEICPEKSLVAGPYHPAFGQLVQSHLALEEMRQALLSWQKGEIPAGSVTVSYCQGQFLFTVPSERLSVYIGQKRCNYIKLQQELGERPIRIQGK